MKPLKLNASIQLRITEREAEIVQALRQKGIKDIEVFRRGLEAYEADLVGDLTQGNVA